MVSTYNNIPLLLMRVRESMMKDFRPILNKYGLTEQQWRILRALYEAGQLESKELCEICCILSPSMARILKRMEELNLIKKTVMPMDKRRVLVKLAPGVERLVKAILNENKIVYERIKIEIGEDSLLSLEETLKGFLIKAT